MFLDIILGFLSNMVDSSDLTHLGISRPSQESREGTAKSCNMVMALGPQSSIWVFSSAELASSKVSEVVAASVRGVVAGRQVLHWCLGGGVPLRACH